MKLYHITEEQLQQVRAALVEGASCIVSEFQTRLDQNPAEDQDAALEILQAIERGRYDEVLPDTYARSLGVRAQGLDLKR